MQTFSLFFFSLLRCKPKIHSVLRISVRRGRQLVNLKSDFRINANGDAWVLRLARRERKRGKERERERERESERVRE